MVAYKLLLCEDVILSHRRLHRARDVLRGSLTLILDRHFLPVVLALTARKALAPRGFLAATPVSLVRLVARLASGARHLIKLFFDFERLRIRLINLILKFSVVQYGAASRLFKLLYVLM